MGYAPKKSDPGRAKCKELSHETVILEAMRELV